MHWNISLAITCLFPLSVAMYRVTRGVKWWVERYDLRGMIYVTFNSVVWFYHTKCCHDTLKH